MRRRSGPRSRIVRSLGILAASVCLGMAAVRAHAQTPAPAAPVPAVSAATPAEPKTHRPGRLYIGMWTTHLKHEVIVLDNNWIIGASWNGFFGATFLNSFGRRAFTGGIERALASGTRGAIGASLGFRLGVVTGYDERFTRLARDIPVLPFAQPFVVIDVEHVGVEVSYTFVVVSLAVSYRF
ncbi:MAG: hypothetical protein ABI652_00680 [Acidobacteriota bacterium]